MELCPNGNLFDMLQKMQGKGISEAKILQIAKAVLKALIFIHKYGFIHRDIKIENILLNKQNSFKVCDFGSCTKEKIDFGTLPKSQYEVAQ